MAVKKIVTEPSSILKKECTVVKKFNKELKSLVEDLLDTVKKSAGVGLAANQIGIDRRVFVLYHEHKEYTFVNPLFTSVAPRVIGDWEGCLSIPGVQGWVLRYAGVTVKAKNVKGEEFELVLEGTLARIAQHELDHLDGVLFVQRMSSMERLVLING